MIAVLILVALAVVPVAVWFWLLDRDARRIEARERSYRSRRAALAEMERRTTAVLAERSKPDYQSPPKVWDPDEWSTISAWEMSDGKVILSPTRRPWLASVPRPTRPDPGMPERAGIDPPPWQDDR